MNKRVCIIGGGISGLCTAFRLKKRGFDVVLLEKTAAVGGNIKSEKSEGFLIEHAPNSALASAHLFDLVAELGLNSEIAYGNPSAKKRYILKNGKLQALPSKIVSLIGNKSFSARAKLRLLKEPFIKSRAADERDESIAEFFARRLGREIVDYAVDPFVSGIFAGNPDNLSLKSAFPQLFELEKNYGSLLKGAIFSPQEKKSETLKNAPSRTVSFKNGMQTLTDRLAENLGASVRTNIEVFEIKKAAGGKFKLTASDEKTAGETFDAVVVSTPSFAAARLVKNLDAALAEQLSGIYHSPVAVVFTAFKKEDIKFCLDGFGFLIPKLERRKILGSLWNSVIFENRAPEGFHLLTTFIGGARNAETVENSEDKLTKIALEELNSILGLSGEPVFAKVKKWEKAIPQYNIGYEKIVRSIEDFKRRNAGIFFCSNFYRGVSVGDCIKNSALAADEIFDYLKEQENSPQMNTDKHR